MSVSVCSVREAVTTVALSCTAVGLSVAGLSGGLAASTAGTDDAVDAASADWADWAWAPMLAANRAAAMARRCGAATDVAGEDVMRVVQVGRGKTGACSAIARTWVRMIGCDFRSFFIA
ncbi:hypothetical protein PanNE5_02220 [Pandoraea sp. NE5]|nr:hypothetical protein PanNE5_02220 [Pandoraea sp. NE5]